MGSVIGKRKARRPRLHKTHGKIMGRVPHGALKQQKEGGSLGHGHRTHGGKGRQHGDAGPAEARGQFLAGNDDRKAVLGRQEEPSDGLPEREFPGGLGKGRRKAR